MGKISKDFHKDRNSLTYYNTMHPLMLQYRSSTCMTTEHKRFSVYPFCSVLSWLMKTDAQKWSYLDKEILLIFRIKYLFGQLNFCVQTYHILVTHDHFGMELNICTPYLVFKLKTSIYSTFLLVEVMSFLWNHLHII